MTFSSLKCCIVGVLLLSSAADVTSETIRSMVCGKPSIRKALTGNVQDISSQSWGSIQKTAKDAVTAMAKAVNKADAELVELEAAAAKKALEVFASPLTSGEITALIGSALAFDSADVAKAVFAKSIDCGYGDAASSENEDQFEESIDEFRKQAKETIGTAGRSIVRTPFMEVCWALIGDESTTCGDLCWEFVEIALEIQPEITHDLAGKTHDQLVREVDAKRKELAQAEKDHAECVDSVATINGLVVQFIAAKESLQKQRRSCSSTRRQLNSQEKKLVKLTVEFDKATKKDEEAQDALKAAMEGEAVALDMKNMAAETLKMWQEHMAALQIAIVAQTKLLSKTEEAVRRADAASAAVSDFKGKLSTALLGLVTYYDEAVRQPLRNMGIREEVDIESLFPTPKDTLAAGNLVKSLAATEAFCKEKLAKFAKLPEIEASGTKLTAICDSQNWGEVSGEVDTVVTSKRARAITSLKSAQKKVASYSGLLADKATGEVEGVWKAMAIFGGTDFSKNYLSGWRFAQEGLGKGSKAGFMMELATALKQEREAAMALWEEAKVEMRKLEEEEKNVKDTLVVCEKFLQDMIVEYDAAVKTREKAADDAKKARDALDLVREQKERMEKAIENTKTDLVKLNAAVEQANADLKESHETALGSFMELLHASEQQEGASWD